MTPHSLPSTARRWSASTRQRHRQAEPMRQARREERPTRGAGRSSSRMPACGRVMPRRRHSSPTRRSAPKSNWTVVRELITPIVREAPAAVGEHARVRRRGHDLGKAGVVGLLGVRLGDEPALEPGAAAVFDHGHAEHGARTCGTGQAEALELVAHLVTAAAAHRIRGLGHAAAITLRRPPCALATSTVGPWLSSRLAWGRSTGRKGINDACRY